MVAPVTGPISSSVSTPTKYKYQQKWRQVKPIDRPLAYYVEGSDQTAVLVGIQPETAGQAFGGTPNGWASYTNLQNVSYDRLKSMISDSASWAVNLAEYRQSVAMMTQRLGSLIQFSRLIRKRDFSGALVALGFYGDSPKKFKPFRKAADNWLEFSFGWKPLIQDIYSSVDFLQDPIKAINLKGSARGLFFLDSNPSAGGLIWSRRVHQGTMKVKQGCTVSISNPNLYLANRLGLANPAVVAWELIPFSFVVDWFVNVEAFLSQGTDFLGLTVTNPWCTCSYKANVRSSWYNAYSYPAYRVATYGTYYTERRLALSGVTLKAHPPRIWGWQRAANAAAVLTQTLSGLKK